MILAITGQIPSIRYISPTNRKTCIISISADKLFISFSVHIFQHFVQQDDFLLDFVKFRQCLRTIIRFGIWIRPCQRFHQFLGSCKISRCPPSNEFLKLGRLRNSVFLFKLFSSFKILKKENEFSKSKPRKTTYSCYSTSCVCHFRQVPKSVSLERQESMHIANIAKVFFPSAIRTNSLLPTVDQI